MKASTKNAADGIQKEEATEKKRGDTNWPVDFFYFFFTFTSPWAEMTLTVNLGKKKPNWVCRCWQSILNP